MATTSAIEWTDATFNPWIGCTKVGPGCDHCYAERDMDTRRGRAKWGPGQERSRTSPDYWKQPLRWNRVGFWCCKGCGWRGELGADVVPRKACPRCDGTVFRKARRRVFCASLADVFDNEVPTSWRIDLFSLIRSTPNLDWLLLTKRIGNVTRMLDDVGGWVGIAHGPRHTPLPNIWLGATVVNQEELDRDVPKLLATPAAVRFLSIEPMLGPITFVGRFAYANPADGTNMLECLDWVIAGGESGPGARPVHPEWIRELRDSCEACEVPFLFKQWGEWHPAGQVVAVPPAVMTKELQQQHERAGRFIHEHDMPFWRLGKKSSGRLLDGREHNGFPR